jgi:hypothetical protein
MIAYEFYWCDSVIRLPANLGITRKKKESFENNPGIGYELGGKIFRKRHGYK